MSGSPFNDDSPDKTIDKSIKSIHNDKSFKTIHSFEKRKEEAERILSLYTDRIPIIVERSKTKGNTVPLIDRNKFLTPSDLTVGQFLYVIRRRIRLTPEKALFLYVNNTLPTTNSLLSQVYKELKDQDGFLYFEYAGENTFGTYRLEE